MVNRVSALWPQAVERSARRAALKTLKLEREEKRHPWLLFEKRTEMGIRLTGDAEIQAYNRQYRNRDCPTNVLSFALNDGVDPPGPELGDLLLAYETIHREAAVQKKSLQTHLTHLVVHGTLHLLGYNHEQSFDEAMRQESREVEVLARLGLSDPYRS